ncbi:acyl-CoA ligase (AMP-forming) (exosortase A-associated) [Sphingomonas zeicaulis]|uniref:acyl-CoA ligase (AMP-forming), exosortase A system-associated n=1 Tax=Sphingomonas zeicaulis TaxID=1632740 RepID=UPI003D20104A
MLTAEAQTLDRLVLRGALDAPALIGRFGTLDYAALDALTGHVAAGLRAQGLEPGDRVASWLAKTRLACVLPLAAARAGLIHVPINPLLKHAQVAHILADSGARLLIAGDARATTLGDGDVPAGCVLLTETQADDVLPGNPERLPPSDGDADRLAAILYTSGSTGRPKGVMLSHANLWLGAIAVADYLRLTSADRTLCVLPLSFDYGQNQLLSAWAAGAAAIPLDYLTPRDVIRAVETHEATTLAGVPPLWTQLVEVAWPPEVAAKLKRLTNSGGALGTSLVRRLRDVFPGADLYPMYGLTEAFRSTYLDPSLVDSHPESMGRAIPFAEILVVRPDGSPTDADEPGELVHAGPLVAKGYWNDPERSAERFRPAPPVSAYGGTAVWSGDTVMRDGEGLLYFVGRDDEMIKSAGNRISPTEIEEAAIASGAVAEAVAIGLPDERLGQAIHLIVRPAKRLKAAKAEERLRTALKLELPGFMQPHQLHWRDALPRSPNGKLDRAGLKREIGG